MENHVKVFKNFDPPKLCLSFDSNPIPLMPELFGFCKRIKTRVVIEETFQKNFNIFIIVKFICNVWFNSLHDRGEQLFSLDFQ